MDKKLTLSLDQDVIEKAKEYAKQHQISLSRLIEAYLRAIVEKNDQEVEITPLVKSLSGVIRLPDGLDITTDYTNFLLEKYK